MLTTLFLNTNPIAIKFGAISTYWYGIAYVLGVILGIYITQLLEKKYKIADIASKNFDNLAVYIIIGIIIGGRLGYVLFYIPSYIIDEPIEILKIWHGGMSFHGGMIGVTIAIWLFCLRYKKKFLAVTDLTACATPIGLFFGRIANFINAELYGKKTGADWGVIFPNIGLQPRHPSQLYEAFTEGFLLFLIMLAIVRISNIRKYTGRISGVFLISYSIFRMLVEMFREPDSHIGYIFNLITLGQLLCFPMLILGIFLYMRKNTITKAYKNKISLQIF